MARCRRLLCLALLVSAAGIPSQLRAASPEAPPNILLVVSDQLIPWLTGAYGNPVVRTPNLDRLTAAGGRFDSANSSHPTVAHILALRGYETALCGKMHFVGPDPLHVD